MKALNWYYVLNFLSGGGAGADMAKELRDLGAKHIIDITSVDPLSFLKSCESAGQSCCIAGGDGTVASILALIDQHNLQVQTYVIPLGTGNDLAHVLGVKSSARLELVQTLQNYESQGRRQMLDRWSLQGPVDLPLDTSFNYISFGFDAVIARRFDSMRKKNPSLFPHALVNKAWYAGISLSQSTRRKLRMRLFMDGEEIELARSSRSLVCANIASYAGGFELGPDINSEDGRIDCFALPAGISAGLALVKRKRSPKAFGAAKSVRVELSQPLIMQCDGEAFPAAPGVYHISHQGQVPVMALRTES